LSLHGNGISAFFILFQESFMGSSSSFLFHYGINDTKQYNKLEDFANGYFGYFEEK
jgi:hypothetical protein